MGTSSQAGHWTGRPWDAVRQLAGRTSLRTKLIAAVFALVVIALAVISIVGAMFMRTYLIGQVDQTLQNGGLQHLAGDAAAGSNGSAVAVAQAGYAVWWLPSGGSLQQIVQPSDFSKFGGSPGSGVSNLPPSVTSALAANPGLTATVPGQTPGDRWRVISFTANVNGSNGTVFLATDVSKVYTTIQQLLGVDLIVSMVILFVLLIVGYAVVRSNLRPL